VIFIIIERATSKSKRKKIQVKKKKFVKGWIIFLAKKIRKVFKCVFYFNYKLKNIYINLIKYITKCIIIISLFFSIYIIIIFKLLNNFLSSLFIFAPNDP
jgi:hypothetical protein